jgi:hypothetical protein
VTILDLLRILAALAIVSGSVGLGAWFERARSASRERVAYGKGVRRGLGYAGFRLVVLDAESETLDVREGAVH